MNNKIIEKAKERASSEELPYAGDVTPQEAWELVQSGDAVIVDVRTVGEYQNIGYVPDSVLVPWQSGMPPVLNPAFVSDIEKYFAKDTVILLLCRASRRSVKAAIALKSAGFTSAFNILEGFEGAPDAQGQTGNIDGWKFHQLPWQR